MPEEEPLFIFTRLCSKTNDHDFKFPAPAGSFKVSVFANVYDGDPESSDRVLLGAYLCRFTEGQPLRDLVDLFEREIEEGLHDDKFDPQFSPLDYGVEGIFLEPFLE